MDDQETEDSYTKESHDSSLSFWIYNPQICSLACGYKNYLST